MKSINHLPFASNGGRSIHRTNQRRRRACNSPHSILLRLLFKQPQPQLEAQREPRRVRVKAMISETGWQFIITDVESRALIFRSDASTSDTPHLALNRGISWGRLNLPNTPISVSLPPREMHNEAECAA